MASEYGFQTRKELAELIRKEKAELQQAENERMVPLEANAEMETTEELWEDFIPQRVGTLKVKRPLLRYLSASHKFILNEAAFNLLNEPSAINIQYNRTKNVLRITVGTQVKINRERTNTFAFRSNALAEFLQLNKFPGRNFDWVGVFSHEKLAYDRQTNSGKVTEPMSIIFPDVPV